MSDVADTPGVRSGVPLRVRLLLAGAVGLCAACWLWSRRERTAPAARAPLAAALPTRLPPEALSEAEADREAAAVPGGYRREVVRPRPVQNLAAGNAPKDEETAGVAPGGPSSRRRDDKRTLPEIFRMPPDPAGTEREPPPLAGPARASAPLLGDRFAPFGRMVKCQLVDTLDSVTSRSEPIVALVTQDLDWNGQVIIPAGTEAFSYAKPEAVIDALGVGRLVDSGEWTLVLPGGGERENGQELVLRARAVDRRETALSPRGRARSWGIDDGADGLVGYTLSTLDDREIKLFAAAAASGMAQGLSAVAERQEPAPGVAGALGATQLAPTLGNAAVGSLGAGAVEVMNQMAGRIREEISKRGVYVRVPAGKLFYLFVEQTIDPRAAAIGLRLPANPLPSR